MIRSLLQHEGIRHYVQNDNVGTLYGAFAGGALRKAIFVAEGDESRARRLLESVIVRTAAPVPGAVETDGRPARKQKHAVGRLLMMILMMFFLVPFAFMVIRTLKGLFGP